MLKSALPKIFVSGIAIALLLILSFRGIGVSAGAVALAIVAVLPWLAPIIDTMDLPGGVSFRFREVERKVQRQEEQLNAQQGIINQLVVYSMAYYLFDILSHLYHGREYLFENNEGMQRSLRHLRDHGYLEHFNMSDLAEGMNLAGRLSLTPVANFLVEVRESLQAEQSTQAAKRLAQLPGLMLLLPAAAQYGMRTLLPLVGFRASSDPLLVISPPQYSQGAYVSGYMV